ncbi:Phenylalanyl-tRNA synthetase beta subunit [Methanonatronarchaeum thermophilum]|uniref:Phenylalanine--tRNA ligase beta subunit n=1 Tax=Methanonatronarchaeum thermophilum TaxID=1927129 RepID=A0A1Y3GDE4_9EURY|nr:phenylalanine--tRNA ligase subunit beta [Methanonatronarchaeum thermophilum]OUJ19257.1 Phenylalanyl-tRNA synthetase beta subunit [Methanonatronarchaeum thermophilum]
MPVIEIDLPEIEELVQKDRETILDRVPMIGADVERIEGETAYIEFFPNRPDLFSIEGIARALKGFLETETGLPQYKTKQPKTKMKIHQSVNQVRPEAVGAIVKNLKLNEKTIKTIMDLQENLHWGLGRDRKKVSIGIHDLDKTTPPFTYKAVNPNTHPFTPLNTNQKMTPKQILKKHPKGQKYKHIIQNSKKYPIITDNQNQILSFPPIINSKLTEVNTNTKNVFIDVTGTQKHSINKALNIITTALAERNGQIEQIQLTGKTNQKTPNLKPKKHTIKHKEIQNLIGQNITPQQATKALEKMRYKAKQKQNKIEVWTPNYRADILHKWDIIEDIAIGYGYQNIQPKLPKTPGIGSSHPTEELGDKLRDIMTGLGYNEVMTLTLTNKQETKKLNKQTKNPVKIQNPISTDHTILRETIYPKLMQILKLNKHRDLPQKIFEYGECFHQNKKINECRHLTAIAIGPKMNYSQIKSHTEAILNELNTKTKHKPLQNGPYIPGRAAKITKNNKKIGEYGEIHPKIIQKYELNHPITALEIEPQKIPKNQTKTH